MNCLELLVIVQVLILLSVLIINRIFMYNIGRFYTEQKIEQYIKKMLKFYNIKNNILVCQGKHWCYNPKKRCIGIVKQRTKRVYDILMALHETGHSINYEKNGNRKYREFIIVINTFISVPVYFLSIFLTLITKQKFGIYKLGFLEVVIYIIVVILFVSQIILCFIEEKNASIKAEKFITFYIKKCNKKWIKLLYGIGVFSQVSFMTFELLFISITRMYLINI